MNKNKKVKIISFLLVFTLCCMLLPANTEAAAKVKISKSKATVYVGKTIKLRITGTRKKVKWISGNKKVATVSRKGKVTAKKAGTAIITAKVSGKSYKCRVTVKKKKTPHTHSYTVKITTPATCTTDGAKTYTCSCGDFRAERIKATGHSWDTGKITEEPTCFEEGIKTYFCSKCGATKTEKMEELGHDNYWETNDNTRTQKCGRCGTTGITEKCYNGYWGYFDASMADDLFDYCNSQRQKAQYVEHDVLGNVIYAGTVPPVIRERSFDDYAQERILEALSTWVHPGRDISSYSNSEILAKDFDTVFDVVYAWVQAHDYCSTITYQYYTQAGAAWFWYDKDGTGENLIGVAAMEYSSDSWVWDDDIEW